MGARRHPEPPGHVLGIDSGGSGLRVAVAPVDGPGIDGLGEPLTWSSPTPAVVGARGVDARSLLDQVVPAARELLREAGAERPAAACVGAAGMAALGGELRTVLPDALRRALGVRRLALAADGVIAYAGALGQRPGAVVAAGTGLIALGTDLAAGWRRADGWGHLLGDCGGGAWIGRAGLEAALRAHDGRHGGSVALLARAEAVFGPAGELPGALYPRADRPAVLASFAPEVGRCAAEDPVAARILRQAARHIAEAAEAVCPHGAHPAGEAPERGDRGSPGTRGRAWDGHRTPTTPADPESMAHPADLAGHAGPADGRAPGAAAGRARTATAVAAAGHAPGRAAGRGETCTVALTGGLFRMGEPLLRPVRAELWARLPHARVVESPADPLAGALRVAAALATDRLLLPQDAALLRVM
ncbi:N-acetylglucosamine kinase [Streptomyces sp. XD-27]|uniref:N-acetylglucosamine kinase n=1 Tax=Streptomyces sp. XD-27 TaxID=3062779 RepID=UPI0026F42AF2|nr:BadF/BadG/BcrA/BcrD ATPase family protein [Streptomyces sp. XD-27]WKX73565.1 BadF/BadG/BcrA/BcrD ATPase family protein [Streptomyces sp. XD-27]